MVPLRPDIRASVETSPEHSGSESPQVSQVNMPSGSSPSQGTPTSQSGTCRSWILVLVQCWPWPGSQPGQLREDVFVASVSPSVPSPGPWPLWAACLPHRPRACCPHSAPSTAWHCRLRPAAGARRLLLTGPGAACPRPSASLCAGVSVLRFLWGPPCPEGHAEEWGLLGPGR